MCLTVILTMYCFPNDIRTFFGRTDFRKSPKNLDNIFAVKKSQHFDFYLAWKYVQLLSEAKIPKLMRVTGLFNIQ